jgi:hypothetical protein
VAFHGIVFSLLAKLVASVSLIVVMIISLVATLSHRMACSSDRSLDSDRVSEWRRSFFAQAVHGVINLSLMTMVIPSSDTTNPDTWPAACRPTWHS